MSVRQVPIVQIPDPAIKKLLKEKQTNWSGRWIKDELNGKEHQMASYHVIKTECKR